MVSEMLCSTHVELSAIKFITDLAKLPVDVTSNQHRYKRIIIYLIPRSKKVGGNGTLIAFMSHVKCHVLGGKMALDVRQSVKEVQQRQLPW